MSEAISIWEKIFGKKKEETSPYAVQVKKYKVDGNLVEVLPPSDNSEQARIKAAQARTQQIGESIGYGNNESVRGARDASGDVVGEITGGPIVVPHNKGVQTS